VSYYEWVQNRTGEYWSRERVLEKLRSNIVNAFKNFQQIDAGNTDREKAYIQASKKLVKAQKARGI